MSEEQLDDESRLKGSDCVEITPDSPAPLNCGETDLSEQNGESELFRAKATQSPVVKRVSLKKGIIDPTMVDTLHVESKELIKQGDVSATRTEFRNTYKVSAAVRSGGQKSRPKSSNRTTEGSGSGVKKRRRIIKRKPSSPEMDWGVEERQNKVTPKLVFFRVVIVLLLVGGMLGILRWSIDKNEMGRSKNIVFKGEPLDPLVGNEPRLTVNAEPDFMRDDPLYEEFESAEEVAKKFLAETDSAKRLQWVRNSEEVKTRMAQYPEEARSAAGKIEKVIGHRRMDGEEDSRALTAFVVDIPKGNPRLLELVATEDGPRVDWDAYARYGTVSWEDLLSGKVERAVVRVFCEPSVEHSGMFADQTKWTGFRLSSVDMPTEVQAFAEVGTAREKLMKQVILGSPRYRQRFVLEIVRHAGEGAPMFEITRCIAVGWVIGERDADADPAWAVVED